MPYTSKQHINKYKLEDPYIESDLQGKIGRWLKDGNYFDHVGEVKLCVGGTLNFNKFEDQQLPSLWKSHTSGKYHKISDFSPSSKPFDYACWKGGQAYVVCQFWKKIQQEICYYMHIRDVMSIKKSGAKALNETDFMLRGFTINLAKYKKGIKKNA